MKFENDSSILQRKMSSSYVGVSRRQAMIKALNINIGDIILDVGCGGGQLIEDIAKSVGIADKAIGIDPSSSQISSAKELCSGLENTLFICCLANNIDLESESVDAVASIQTFEYIDDIDEALTEIKRLLKPRAKFLNISTLWDYYRFHGPEKKLNDLMHDVFKEHCSHQMVPTFLNGRLKNLGFKDIKTTELAYVFTKRDENSFAKYAETLIANFALSKGVEKEKVSEWQRQIKKAEENGRFCFTSIPVLTEAILEK